MLFQCKLYKMKVELSRFKTSSLFRSHNLTLEMLIYLISLRSLSSSPHFSPSVPFSLSNVWLIFHKCYIWRDSLQSKELFLKEFVWFDNITFWTRKKSCLTQSNHHHHYHCLRINRFQLERKFILKKWKKKQ